MVGSSHTKHLQTSQLPAPSSSGGTQLLRVHVLFTCEPSKTASVPREVNSKEEVIAHEGMGACVVQMRGGMLVSVCSGVSSELRVSHQQKVSAGVKKSL